MTTYTWWIKLGTKEIGISAQCASPDGARRDLLNCISLVSIADIESVREQISISQPRATACIQEVDPPQTVRFNSGWVWFGTALAATIAVISMCVSLFNATAARAGTNIFPPHSIRWGVDIVITGVAGVFAVFCILFGIRLSDVSNNARFRKSGRIRIWKMVLLGLWVMLPPIWFSFEYFFFYPQPAEIMRMHDDIEQPVAATQPHTAMTEAEILREHFEKFNKGQENASKVWVAVVTLLTALYFGKEIGTKRD